MRVLLDTNAYTALHRRDAATVRLVRRAEGVTMSTIVLGELLFGFRHGTRFAHHRAELEAFLDAPFVTVAPVTRATAERFGLVAAALRRKGRPIPQNDVWIAAHALETGTDLVSFDRHFADVDALSWRSPADG